MRGVLGLLVTSLATTGACSAPPPPVTPRQTLDEYALALETKDYRRAYSLLSDEAKKDLIFEGFEKIVAENPEEMAELVEALRKRTGAPLVTAIVSAPTGESVLLVYEQGAWRVDGSALDLYGQQTPKKAIMAFIRAFENQRFDVLMRFVPETQRAGLTEQQLKAAWQGEQEEDIRRKVAALKASLPTARFELLGRRATMAYGAAGTVELVREHGAWKIEELE